MPFVCSTNLVKALRHNNIEKLQKGCWKKWRRCYARLLRPDGCTECTVKPVAWLQHEALPMTLHALAAERFPNPLIRPSALMKTNIRHPCFPPRRTRRVLGLKSLVQLYSYPWPQVPYITSARRTTVRLYEYHPHRRSVRGGCHGATLRLRRRYDYYLESRSRDLSRSLLARVHVQYTVMRNTGVGTA